MIPPCMVFSTWEDLFAYVRHTATDEKIERMNRWFPLTSMTRRRS